MDAKMMFPESRFSRFLFSDTRMAWLWLIVRVYAGWIWLAAGWEKINNPAWVGEEAGTAVSGFLNGALAKMVGEHPDVSQWYAWFINNFAMDNATIFSYVVAYGEVAVGLGLIVGFLTGIAAFFGVLMNFNFLFAGTVSINPQLIILGILIMLAWRTAGWWGLDRWLLRLLRRRPVIPVM